MIAWPLKPSGRINDDDRNKLFKAWHLLLVQDNNVNSLNDILPEHGVDAADIRAVFSRLSLNGKVLQSGYQSNEHAGLFSDIEHPAQAQARVPAFLAEIANPKKPNHGLWTRHKRNGIGGIYGPLRVKAYLLKRYSSVIGCGSAAN
ncbi:hypothetical protein OGZ01_06165 [Vibrio harveyi]|nr:hypothetical protein [Vibrio harveyi]